MLDYLHNLFFSPLGAEHCSIYYVLLIITFIAVIFNILMLIYFIFMPSNKFKSFIMGPLIFHSIATIFYYYIIRVTYSICINAYN